MRMRLYDPAAALVYDSQTDFPAEAPASACDGHTFAAGNDLPTEDLRGRLLRYMRDPGRSVRAYGELADLCESPFERDVLRHLLGREYAVTPQYRVGRFRIDFVVNGLRSRLAVECDGKAFHGPEEWENDRRRQESSSASDGYSCESAAPPSTATPTPRSPLSGGDSTSCPSTRTWLSRHSQRLTR
jgi:very-short-patch-repair endonuclease